MRLFIALNFGESDRAAIHEATRPLRKGDYPVRWLPPEKYHLTLKFLGNVRPDDVSVVEKVVRRVTGETTTFDLTLRQFGAFPTIRRPQVLWLGAVSSPALRCLKQDLEWSLASHGFDRETRSFHPHVTLGRASAEEGAGAFRDLDAVGAAMEFERTIPLATVDLMRSSPRKSGPEYSLIERAPLRAPAE